MNFPNSIQNLLVFLSSPFYLTILEKSYYLLSCVPLELGLILVNEPLLWVADVSWLYMADTLRLFCLLVLLVCLCLIPVLGYVLILSLYGDLEPVLRP